MSKIISLYSEEISFFFEINELDTKINGTGGTKESATTLTNGINDLVDKAIKEAENKIIAIKERLDNGEKFEVLARQFSEDSTASNGPFAPV